MKSGDGIAPRGVCSYLGRSFYRHDKSRTHGTALNGGRTVQSPRLQALREENRDPAGASQPGSRFN